MTNIDLSTVGMVNFASNSLTNAAKDTIRQNIADALSAMKNCLNPFTTCVIATPALRDTGEIYFEQQQNLLSLNVQQDINRILASLSQPANIQYTTDLSSTAGFISIRLS